MKKKLKLFRRLETLKKKEIIKEQHQSILISKEILKADGLIEKIDMIISENSMVDISEECWRMEGSRMFIKEGTKVSISELLKSLIKRFKEKNKNV